MAVDLSACPRPPSRLIGGKTFLRRVLSGVARTPRMPLLPVNAESWRHCIDPRAGPTHHHIPKVHAPVLGKAPIAASVQWNPWRMCQAGVGLTNRRPFPAAPRGKRNAALGASILPTAQDNSPASSTDVSSLCPNPPQQSKLRPVSARQSPPKAAAAPLRMHHVPRAAGRRMGCSKLPIMALLVQAAGLTARWPWPASRPLAAYQKMPSHLVRFVLCGHRLGFFKASLA